MASPKQSAGKICVICHEDCSARPRVKDRAGHYYCQVCYDRAKRQLEARKRAAARAQSAAVATPTPAPEQPPAGDSYGALEAAAAQAAAAAPVEVAQPAAFVAAAAPVRPSPQVRLPAMPKPARPERERTAGLPEVLKQPWFAFVLPAAILGVLFLLARNNEELVELYKLPQSLFGLVVGVIVLVQAFRESIGTGILTLCLPFYVFYFVFFVNENPHIKALFGVSVIAAVAGLFVGPSLAEPMQMQPGYFPS
jgi:hypothetical protein